MASFPETFRFGEFAGSLLWLVFWIIVIVTLVGLPLIFIVLFYVPLPEIDGEVLTPYLFLTSILYPQSMVPVIETLLDSTLFKVAVFPGFTYGALIAAATIFIERKFLAKMQLRVGPLYASLDGLSMRARISSAASSRPRLLGLSAKPRSLSENARDQENALDVHNQATPHQVLTSSQAD